MSTRILWLTENYPPQRGGMAQSCDRIVRGLRDTGIIIDVAHFSGRHVEWRIGSKRNGLYISCPVHEDPAHAMNRLWNLLENDQSRVEYTHVVAFGGLLPMLAAPVYAAWLQAPLITLIRGNDFDAGIFSLKRGDVLRHALASSSQVCAVSLDKVRKISALYPNLKVSWTPNGIDLSDWKLTEGDHETAKQWRRQTVPSGRRVLGLFGQLKRKKGGLFFLESLLRSGRVGQFHLLVIGDIETEMQEWLEAHGTGISFTVLPFLDHYELMPFFAACDMIVIPSFYDGLPNVLLEAMGLGIPVLASRVGGMADFLVDGEHGILFAPGDFHGCRRAIERAAQIDSNELLQLGNNSFSLVRGSLSHSAEVQRYSDLFAGSQAIVSQAGQIKFDAAVPDCAGD